MVNILLSYPRSANSWIRYFVEVVTGLPSSQGTFTDSASNNPKSDALVHKSVAKPAAILKRHRFDFEWDHWEIERDFLLVLVRDYRECIIRNIYKNCSKAEYQRRAVDKYMHVIESYHNWSGPKLLTYYEDLITNPAKELNKISKHFGLDVNKTKLFINDLPEHIRKSIILYYPGSITQGMPNKSHYHADRKALSAQNISVLIKKQPAELYVYVKRYE